MNMGGVRRVLSRGQTRESRPSAMASASSSDAPAPVVGQRLSVYWTKPKEYFDGRIISVSQQLGSGKKKSNYSVEVL